MTLSEMVQAHRIRELKAGRGGDYASPALECGNDSRLIVEAGSGAPLSFPLDDAGPWTMFRLSWCGGPVPDVFTRDPERFAVAIAAGDLVRLLERLGWPEAQLGRRWKKPMGGAVPVER